MMNDTVKIKQIIEDSVKEYYRVRGKHYTREYSWNLCYEEFYNIRQQKIEIIDEKTTADLARELAAYLASFGMYRNSILLDVNYRFYERFIPILFMDDYLCLDNDPSEHIDIILKLFSHIKETLESIREEYGLDRNVTDTLVSKIILGVYGCVVAYDTKVIASLKAMKKYREMHTGFCEPSVIELYDFYKEMDIHSYFKGEEMLTPMREMDIVLWFAKWEDESQSEAITHG